MDRYLVVGNPIEHSLSPQIHAAFAAQTGEAMSYGKALVPIGGFAEFVDDFLARGGKGLNVTVPFKIDAHAYVQQRDLAAEAAAAVNTIAVEPDGAVRGYNTDGIGLLRDLVERLGIDIAGARILILGAGGAVQGILKPLIDARPGSITIANRTVSKARALAASFARHEPAMKLQACGLDDIGGPADLIINSTSLGLSGGHVSLPFAVVRDAFCYDLAYGGGAHFSRWAEAQGARGASDGLGMLVGQAAESFRIWRGVCPEVAPVYAMLRAELDDG